MSRRVLAVLTFVFLLAGCLTPDDPESTSTTTPAGTVIDENRPEPTFGTLDNESLGTPAGPDLNATLAAAPKLVAGEYWKILFTDSFSGTQVEFIRVVAKVEPGGYVIGMPHEAWYKEAVVYHTPAFGDVNLDLSYHAHDVPFLPLKFPLTDGATWDTHWESENPPLKATVTVVNETVARVTFVGPDCNIFIAVGQCPEVNGETTVIELVYDAAQHEVVSLDAQNFFGYEVVEHGYDFQGWITVPRGEDLVFLNGRLGASTINFPDAGPALPTETVKVDGGFNRLSFILATGNFVGETGGAYKIVATAPDGTEYTKEMTPGGPFAFDFFEATDPDGDWLFEYTVAGPGAAFIEGIAYHQYDIRLPDGLIRSDHSHDVVR